MLPARQRPLLRRQHGAHRQQVTQRAAFLIRKLLTILRRTEQLIALLRWQVTQFTEGAGDYTASILWQRAKLPHGAAHLPALVGGEALHLLAALQHTRTLLGRHAVQPVKPVHHALLRLLRQLVEAWLVLQGSLLLLHVQLVVALHPLLQMLATRGTWACVLRLCLPEVLRGATALPIALPADVALIRRWCCTARLLRVAARGSALREDDARQSENQQSTQQYLSQTK